MHGRRWGRRVRLRAGRRGSGAPGPQRRDPGRRPARPGSLDPARADRLEDEVVLGNLFDGLTAIDPAGAARPAVAASWSSDSALRRWEFHLRPDARWSDGSPVRAADFIFAWRRLADPKAFAGAAVPAARTLLSGVTGYHAFTAGRSRTIAGLETPTRPPWSSASTVPSPTSRPWSPPSRCLRSPRPWSAPTRPPT